MDNVLIQVTGRKRVVLYPPQDVDFLYMVGDKSAVLDIDDPDLNRFPLFRYGVATRGVDPKSLAFRCRISFDISSRPKESSI